MMPTKNIASPRSVHSILCVEDNDDDFELIDHHLAFYRNSGIAIEHCDSLATARSRLLHGAIDIILLDLSLPDSQGIDTVKAMHLCAPEIPTIVLSGSGDSDTALESLKFGADDFLLKNSLDTESLGRSINYALARRTARDAIERLATIVEASDDAITGKCLTGPITKWNRGAAKLFGYSEQEATENPESTYIPPELSQEWAGILQTITNGETIRHLETVHINKNGDGLSIAPAISPSLRGDGTVSGAKTIDRDITERKQAQRVLQESEELYRLLVAGVKDYAIFMLNPGGIVESWNEGAKRLKGYEAAEIIGKHFSVFYTPGDRQIGLPDSQLKLAIAKGSSEDQGWRVRKDGSSFFADVAITPLFSAEGELRGFTKITRDITERRRGEQEIADTRLRLSLALEAAAIGVWDFDLLKNSVWRSQRHDEIFGHQEPLSEWNFDTFLGYVLPQDLVLAKEAFQLAVGHGRLKLQCRIIRAGDNAVRWVSSRGEAFRNEQGVAVRMLGTIIDITDVKEQHEQQRMLAIMKEREDFMATLTHDMKNPLIGSNRLLELFLAGSLGELTSHQSEMIQCLQRSNSGLLKLIADLIDVYRFEKDVSDLAMADCDLVLTISSCMSRIAPFAKIRSLNVTTQLPEKMLIRADKNRIERVVQNLLDNALKFAPDGGMIEIRLLNIDANDVIEIEDNGPGIPLDEQACLFNRFFQGTAGKRYTGGSGLGLYLCKQIIEAHGGTIECRSHSNSPTIFRVNFPKATIETQEKL